MRNNEVELAKSNVCSSGYSSNPVLLAARWPDYRRVPFAIVDATTLTEAGYVGEDVENIVSKLASGRH